MRGAPLVLPQSTHAHSYERIHPHWVTMEVNECLREQNSANGEPSWPWHQRQKAVFERGRLRFFF